MDRRRAGGALGTSPAGGLAHGGLRQGGLGAATGQTRAVVLLGLSCLRLHVRAHGLQVVLPLVHEAALVLQGWTRGVTQRVSDIGG